MTIKQIENWLNLLRSEYRAKYNVEAEEANEAVKAAIEALERQIPKKPMNVMRNHYENLAWDKGDCPCCGSKNTSDLAINYCRSCGQALDWQEV